MKKAILTCLALFVASASIGAQGAPDAKKVEAGKAAYEKYGCAKCHMIAGKGSKISPLDGVGTKLSAADLKMWITDPAAMQAKLPKKPIVPMKKVDMPDADVDAIVAYLQTIKK
jgi:mono/diheme cytochrome c family protein